MLMIDTILWRLEGEPNAEGMYADFSDVVQGSWYEKAVGWAAELRSFSSYGTQSVNKKQEFNK
jgi:hypothetical protein